MNDARRNRLRFGRWETWVALIACGCCAGFGDWIGRHLGYPTLGAILGGAVGGLMLQQARRRLEARNTP